MKPQHQVEESGSACQHQEAKTKEWEGDFELVDFTNAPEPMVAAHIPMQED